MDLCLDKIFKYENEMDWNSSRKQLQDIFFFSCKIRHLWTVLYMNIYELRLQMHTLYVVHNIMISFQTFLLLFFL